MRKLLLLLLALQPLANAFFTEYSPLLYERNPSFYDLLVIPKPCPFTAPPQIRDAPLPDGFSQTRELLAQAKDELGQSAANAMVRKSTPAMGTAGFVIDRYLAYECRSHAANALRLTTRAAANALASADASANELAAAVEPKHNNAASGLLELAAATGFEVQAGRGNSVGALLNKSSAALGVAWQTSGSDDWKVEPAFRLLAGEERLAVITATANFSIKSRQALLQLELDMAAKSAAYSTEYDAASALLSRAEADGLQTIATDGLPVLGGPAVAVQKPEAGPAEKLLAARTLLRNARDLAGQAQAEQSKKPRGWLSRSTLFLEQARQKAGQANYATAAAIGQAGEAHEKLLEKARGTLANAEAAVKAASEKSPQEAGEAANLLKLARQQQASLPAGNLAQRIKAASEALQAARDALDAANAVLDGKSGLIDATMLDGQAALALAGQLQEAGIDSSSEQLALQTALDSLKALGRGAPLSQITAIRQAVRRTAAGLEEIAMQQFTGLEAAAGEFNAFADFFGEGERGLAQKAASLLLDPTPVAHAAKARPLLLQIRTALGRIKADPQAIAQKRLEMARVTTSFPDGVELDKPARLDLRIEFEGQPSIEAGPMRISSDLLKLPASAVLAGASQSILAVDFERGEVQLSEYGSRPDYWLAVEYGQTIASTTGEKTTVDGVGLVRTAIEFRSLQNALVKVTRPVPPNARSVAFAGNVVGQNSVATTAMALVDAREGENSLTLQYVAEPIAVETTVGQIRDGFAVQITASNNGAEPMALGRTVERKLPCEIASAKAVLGSPAVSYYNDTLFVKLEEKQLDAGEQRKYALEAQCEGYSGTLQEDSSVAQEAVAVKRAAGEALASDDEITVAAGRAVELAAQGRLQEAKEALKQVAASIAERSRAIEKECGEANSPSACAAIGAAAAKARGLASINLLEQAVGELGKAQAKWLGLKQQAAQELAQKIAVLGEYTSQKTQFRGALESFEKAFEADPGKRKPSSYAAAKKSADALAKDIAFLDAAAMLEQTQEGLAKHSPTVLENKLATAVVRAAEVKNAVDGMEEQASGAIEAAAGRVKQFGTASDEAALQDAKESFGKGNFFTAYTIASQAKDLLPPPSGGRPGPPDWLLGASGIAILSTAAYFFLRGRQGPREYAE